MTEHGKSRDDFLAHIMSSKQIIQHNGSFVFAPAEGERFVAHEIRWIGNELDRLNRAVKIDQNTYVTPPYKGD